MQPTYIEPGHTGIITVAHSEAATYMRVAGKRMRFQVTASTFWPMVQLLQDDGQPFSFPILPGEAGVYAATDGRLYYYPNEEEGLSDGNT